MNPLVSVIIGAYNTESYISQAIQSVLSQTINNIEIIVVDDASTDRTAEVAKSFTDQRVRVLVNEQNLGASGARNRALKAAEGEWVAVLDSDDWYAPERLEKLLQVANSENADIVADDLFLIRDEKDTAWSTLIRESGEHINQVKIIDPVYFVETDVYAKPGLHLGISKPLFKRDFLIKNNIYYDENLTVVQDFWLDMDCLIRGARFVLIPEPYYFYRCARPGSLVYSNQQKNLEQCCQKTIDFLAKENIFTTNPKLGRALSKNLIVFQRYLSYYRVIEPIKSKQWLTALIQLFMNPGFWSNFIRRIPGILQRRIAYYLFKDKTVYDIFSSSR